MLTRKGTRRSNLQRMSWALATVCGIGYLPLAPGTWASLTALTAAWVVHFAAPGRERWILGTFLVVALVPAVVASGSLARSLGRSDPPEVVVDEVIGQWICLMFLPFDLGPVSIAFLTFRIFDVWKPFPIRRIERRSGGVGIVGDDIVAGLYAGLFSKALLWLWALR